VVLLRCNSNPAHSQLSPTGGIRTMLWVALDSKRVEATHSIVKNPLTQNFETNHTYVI